MMGLNWQFSIFDMPCHHLKHFLIKNLVDDDQNGRKLSSSKTNVEQK